MLHTPRFPAASRRPMVRGAQVSAAALLMCATLAACSQGGTEATAEPLTADQEEYVAQVRAEVEAATGEITDYPAPGPAFDTSALRGETLYYVPITIQAESFQVTSKAIEEAVTPLGVQVQVCDGGASPDKAAACISEATDVDAAAIISDAIPYGLAANAFDGAKEAGIPILISNQPPPEGYENTRELSYLLGNPIQMMEMAAKWLVADSNGSANVVVNEYTDSPDTKRYMDDYGLKILNEDCPNCTAAVNEISSANFAQIPSSTSAALLRNPDATYFFTQFDTSLQPTMAGIQQAGALQRLKGVSTNGLLGGLKLIKDGNYLEADVASHYSYAGYQLADFAMRMASGAELAQEQTVPIRLITSENIDDVGALTAEAQASGEWFGPTTYKEMFADLWGAPAAGS